MTETLFFAQEYQEYLLKFFIIPVLLISGLSLSFGIKWLHIRRLPLAVKLLFVISEEKSKKNISSFAAFAAILGGNLGVGNISGTAIALSTGGPGAILWMGIIILIASVLKYISCYLGIEYRELVNKRFVGGPMYFMQNALKAQKLAVIFAIATIFGSLTIGNLIQVNSLSLPMQYLDLPEIYGGIFIAIILGLVIIGSARVFANVVSSVVPFMAFSYISLCLYILFLKKAEIIPAINLIFNSGLFLHNIHSLQGGIAGYLVLQALTIVQVGASRAILATDIGLGLEAMLHANVKQEEGHLLPLNIEQGLISVISPFIVLLVCFITALVLITTGVWNSGLESTNMCFTAFTATLGTNLAGYFLMMVLFCFAFTTILTWHFCSSRAIEYLTNYNHRVLKIWNIIFISIIPLGAITQVKLAWQLADTAVSIMLLLNLLAILPLAKKVIKQTREKLINHQK